MLWIVFLFLVGPEIFGDSDADAAKRLSKLMKMSGYVGSCKEECARMGLDHFEPSSVIRILSWTPISAFYQGPWYPEGSGIFDSCEFDPALRCEYTHDKSKLHVSDAVLFRGLTVNYQSLPAHRPDHQKWVFFETKPPRLTSMLQNLTSVKNIFNLTSTYTVDSDIPVPLMRKCTPTPGQMNVEAYQQEDFARKKSRLVAWVNVNHCQTPSRRENYVKKLQEHIQVDIYGQCGSYRCDPSKDLAHCLHTVASRYKFLLAFENVLCRDYITDVLWAVFDHRLKIVPVVLGSSYYSRVLPPGVYIDVRNFTSPLHLANFLTHLHHHDDEYNQYIWRRNFDKCHFRTEYSQYHCALCQHLHLYRGVTEVALDVERFWEDRNQCETPVSFYKGIADEILEDDSPSKAWSFKGQ